MPLTRSTQPVIRPDAPWERGAALFAVEALPDPGSDYLRLYYGAFFQDDPTRNALCMATSTDGRAWTKPDLGDGTNVVLRATPNAMSWGQFMPTTILHTEDAPDPAQRWKLMLWDRPEPNRPPGICLATSPDGIQWERRLGRPIITGANDAMAMIDARTDAATPLRQGPFFIYQQTWRYNPTLPTTRDNLKGMHRRISIWACTAFLEGWVGPVTVLEPDDDDPPDVQFYWLTPFRTEDGGYGGLLNCHHTGNQTMDVQLVSSRDGWTWRREHDRRPILPLGERGRFDCGMVSATARPTRWRGETLLYYNGRATVHDGQLRYPDGPPPTPDRGIGLAILPPELVRARA